MDRNGLSDVLWAIRQVPALIHYHRYRRACVRQRVCHISFELWQINWAGEKWKTHERESLPGKWHEWHEWHDLAQLWAFLIVFFAWFAGIMFLRIRVGIDVSLWLVVIVCALMSIAFLIADYIDMQDWAGAPKAIRSNAHG